MTASTVVFAGGGTAGHISPMLAIASATERLDPSANVSVIGTASGLETRLVPAAGYELDLIEKVPFPRRPNRDLLRFPSQFSQASRQAEQILQARGARVVVGVGGYVCPPVYRAAKKLGIPVVIHEANARPGLANRWGARQAAFVGTAFPNTPLKGAMHVGMPMPVDVSQLERDQIRVQARQELGLDTERTTLVVTGGSSGAQSLNTMITQALPDLLATGAQVLHLTGRDKEVRDAGGGPLATTGYHQREYLDGMHLAYAAADLIVARAGAATVCEVAAVGLPAAFVPLPVGNGEQELNARALVDAGGALLVKDDHFTRAWIERNLVPLLENPRLLATMQQQSAARGITDADERMARAALEAAAR
ncbi:UDP-N-acetylglucosamine--N-acetylmuramyl-(pentapeptide) pyrophosphoryl-undecaprenol N-acetylglucosamine transferase [Nesterenkonia natronophila]|uniref:UDP-N-acetylglucosamine--N-acetylmuramyl-(pentapeptide) pyrophosphoryl-undecaprenol N-acetylglucosamine transferase n=1 Tax=Nesterenkonia natronophila TaxID=2174932 RepID=A0A3A4FDA8_9MICC|nr:UDP-N-acetylglucosamine--N-acetylmuramyl-(pentapeptide) pyrophosphoryl-undecaprenol N-acetylglucosamine transferase [Nesterenkonia natronophila]RJN33087.1 UDP-N-acetylglucosamine--N-acetylmuramyl-(pentapeptide) pyrophosphoryl-undecaprenol N-acetylglucosamine transferase [Nesterenkonia natronophila]